MHYTVAHSISPTSISYLDEAANGEEGEVPAATTVGWESPNDQPADEWGGWLAYDGQSWFFLSVCRLMNKVVGGVLKYVAKRAWWVEDTLSLA